MIEKKKKSFLKYFLTTSLHNGVSILLQKNFAVIFIIGVLLQYSISPSTQPKMSLGFWLNGITSVITVGFVGVLFKYHRLLYCCLKTLPRDIRYAIFTQI